MGYDKNPPVWFHDGPAVISLRIADLVLRSTR